MTIRRVCWVTLLFTLGLAWGLRAEQVRVAVFAPADGARKTAEDYATLWQSLVATEVSRQDLFAVVEREELPAAEREWALSLAAGASGARDAGRPSWLGADLLVIGQLTVTNESCVLSVKVLDVSLGAIEANFTESFALTNLETQARAFAEQLRPAALRWLRGRDIHTLASVLDYESSSRFERARWQEQALARRLRGFLQQQPGVLVLERETVEQLFAETRLHRGGLAKPGDGPTNGWASLQNVPLISGSITETQPAGAPLTLRVTTRVRDLRSDATSEFTETFPLEAWMDGVARLERQLLAVLAVETGKTATGDTMPDRPAEAVALADKAVRLAGSWWFMLASLESLLHHRPSGLATWPGSSFDESSLGLLTPVRQANVLQAVRYLKAAVLADDNKPQLKLLLASLLVDRQVNEWPLAIELATEVGWRFPEWRLEAWGFVHDRTTGKIQERYRQLLAGQFPDSRFARVHEEIALAKFLEQHRNDPDLSAVVDRLRPQLERALNPVEADAALEYEVRRLFELTQITSRTPESGTKARALQTTANRARGTALLEEMAIRHPRHAFLFFYYWSLAWEELTESEQSMAFWWQRAADAADQDRSERVRRVLRWDKARLALARHWMAHDKFKESLPYLEKIADEFLVGERDFQIARCAFETGDFQRALMLFRSFGPERREAVEYTLKCEAILGLMPSRTPPDSYSVESRPTYWSVHTVDLPRGTFPARGADGLPRTNHLGKPVMLYREPGRVGALAVDADSVWLGLHAPGALNPHTHALFDSIEPLRTNVLVQGGLVRWDRSTGSTRFYLTEDGLPCPWVSALAVSVEGLWVGTLAGGVGLLNPRTGGWTGWTETNGLPMNSIRSLSVADNVVWAGCGHLNRGAVCRLDLVTQRWRTLLREDFPAHTNLPPPHFARLANVPPELKQPRVISNVPVSPVTVVSVVDGRLWCAVPPSPAAWGEHLSRGLLVYDQNTNGWHQVLPDAPTSLARVGGRVWASLGAAGLAHGSLEGGDWQRVTRADGLPFDPAVIAGWNGRLLLVGEGVAVLNPGKKQFVIHPFPTPGAAGLMAVQGDDLYVVRGNQLLVLKLSERMTPNSSNNK